MDEDTVKNGVEGHGDTGLNPQAENETPSTAVCKMLALKTLTYFHSQMGLGTTTTDLHEPPLPSLHTSQCAASWLNQLSPTV